MKILQSLNEKQIAAVTEMGFGELIHYNVAAIPRELASWLLKNFDPIKCNIALPGSGPDLHIDESDVELTFGFPRGDIKVERIDRQDDISIMSKIAGVVGVERPNVKASKVAEEMLKDIEGGAWFKKVFLILLESALIETSACGYVRPKILHFIEDITDFHRINWCGYMISVLLKTHRHWKEHKTTTFSGPIAFLVVSSQIKFIIFLC